MPFGDGTGPTGAGPMTGRGMGSRRAGGAGRGGSSICFCPNCGHQEPHQRSIPCSEMECPKCGSAMVGRFCR